MRILRLSGTTVLALACLAASNADVLAEPIVRLTDHLSPADAAAAAPHRLMPSKVQTVSAAATLNIGYDDGEPDGGYGPNAVTADFAMRFDLPRAGMTLDQLEVCLQRGGSDADLQFDLLVWDDDAAGGVPGTLLDFVAASASSVPQGLGGAFYTFDLSGMNITIPGTSVFLGVGWDGVTEPDFFVCGDQDGPTVQPGFVDVNQDGTWQALRPDIDPDYTALMIRATVSDNVTSGPCVPSAHVLCLQNNRFQLEVDFTPPGEASRPGTVIPLTERAGLFWFFNANNVEMLVKVLDACVAPFDRYWVFYAATTNVEFQLRVTDTATQQTRFYNNAQGMAAIPIQDTQAFDTCP